MGAWGLFLTGPLSWGAEPDPWTAQPPACATGNCRWKAAQDEQEATGKQRAQARQSLMDALTPPARGEESTRLWLQRVDEVLARAEKAGKVSGDPELMARAIEAATWARSERRKIPLVGAERAVVLQLLHLPDDPSARIVTWESDSVALHCAMEAERCVGVYLVGRTRAGRVLNAPEQAEETTAMLSQALGQPGPLPTPPAREGGKAPTTSTWTVGAVPVVARWRNSDLMELRVGNVKP
ncbi:hypothetical protein [Corallococcus carmarthensis]|uniref:hypothetical protein n=1 Tax=Corallococcus carmarthensis TaxID=2316728 RepID=UPI0020A4C360|nr:hypothetical protein [Corallococcus carmarthensis]